MRFSLQDVKKSVKRRGTDLFVSLHFLRAEELQKEIEQLIAYYEQMLGKTQRVFSLDAARAYVNDYRLAQCLIATLSNWYAWRVRDWVTVLQETHADMLLAEFSSPGQMRLALYDYVNAHCSGFVDSQTRPEVFTAFAALYHITVADLEYLLRLDSEDEALLQRCTAAPPTAQEVITCYNQWVFEAALFNASSIQFVIDCHAFRTPSISALSTVDTGVGTVIKRLCYLARRLGVYYDLMYQRAEAGDVVRGEQYRYLTLILYGPQEVTGAPQQYGLRLARLCRLLLGYANLNGMVGQVKKKQSFATAIVDAVATIHFLQRSYKFTMNTDLLRLLPSIEESEEQGKRASTHAAAIFDSSIEQDFAEAFSALARNQGVDGWQMEREPEPLLVANTVFIPDFALLRDQRKVYVEILGFWTPAYRERKIQKLQQLRHRDDLLLAIPLEAKDAFARITPAFPTVYYDRQLSVTDVLHILRERYNDFGERLAHIDVSTVRQWVQERGLLSEHECYSVLHCYRRSEIQQAATHIVTDDIAFTPGIGLYSLVWLQQVRQSLCAWLRTAGCVPLMDVVHEIRKRWQILESCDATAVEGLLSLWPEIEIQRDSIFEAKVGLLGVVQGAEAMADDSETAQKEYRVPKSGKRQVRERHAAKKKTAAKEVPMAQGNLWE